MKRIMVIAMTALALVLPLGGTPAEAQQQARRPFKVLAHVSSSTIISGQTVYVRGKVKPLAIGRRVILQKRWKKRSGQWRKVDVSRVQADGKFLLMDTPKTARKRFYRVVKRASDGRRRGVSDKMRVRVIPWDGRVEAKLTWEGDANLDLTLYDPEWDGISETAPGPITSGGVLDPTSTAGCGGPGSFERIHWPDENAPVGRYHAYVTVKDACGATSTSWRLEIRVNGRLVNTVIGSGEKYGINFGGSGGW
jgi:hypothetical protein